MRSFWLCKKAKRKRALRHRVERCEGEPPSVEFEVFEPKAASEVHGGTVTRARATCLCCGAVLPPERVRAQLAAERGGADVIFDADGRRTGGGRMTAVVTLKPGQVGRHYRLPNDADYSAVRKASEASGGYTRRVGAERKTGALPSAGRAVAADERYVQCPTLRHQYMGRLVYGAAEGGVGGVGTADCFR